MKITKISLYKCKVNIGFKYSTWETKSSQAMLIKIETDNGLIGWGEYTINRWKTEKILLSTCKFLLNKNVLEIYNDLILKPITRYNKLDELLIGFDRRRRLVREGISIALYDLLGKYKKKPIYELFDNIEKFRYEVDAMPVIHVHTKEDRLEILQKWEKLGVVHPNPAIMNNSCFTYLARDIEKFSLPQNSGSEYTKVVSHHVDELDELVEKKKITHSLVINAIYWYKMNCK